MLIDIHTHAFHPKIATKAVLHLNKVYALQCEGTGMLADLEKEESQAGIDRYAVLCAATAPAQVIPANNYAINIRRSPDGGIAFGTIHPGYSKWEDELDRLDRNGIRGLKLHPDFQGFSMDDKRLLPVFEACQGRFIVLFHVGSLTDDPLHVPSSPLMLKKVLQAFPRLDVIAAHFGGYRMWELALKVLAGHPVEHLWFDTSSTTPYVDSATLKKLLTMLPEDHYFFGSDWPLKNPLEEHNRFARMSGFCEGQMERLMSNAATLLADYAML